MQNTGSMLYRVVTSSKSKGIGNGLTYASDLPALSIGTAVTVPLRKQFVEGLVLGIAEQKEKQEFDVKHIKEVLQQEPLLTEAQLRTAQWMSEYYIASLRQVLSLWLPAIPWTKLLPERITGYRIAHGNADKVRGPKQKAILEYLEGKEWVSIDELRSVTGATTPILKGLVTKGLLAEEQRQEDAVPVQRYEQLLLAALPVLTESQQSAYESVKGDSRPSLLFGVTGSGKTEIYAKLIEDALRAQKQALLLVPEILLTEHSIRRFEQLLPRSAISIIHSRLSPSERRTEWKRISRGEVALVIGSRSALFSPLRSLGVVILDEEHEWTFKNEQTPRYHARETAETLCRNTGAKLVLGSATPSLETWSRAKSGRYHLATLPTRYRDQEMPSVQIIDLGTASFGRAYPFTPPLLAAIEARLAKNEQCILFLNRRGIASAILCLQCRRRIVSPDSQLPFTLHKDPRGRPYLLDHTSGLSVDLPSACPHCKGTQLTAIGAGTQKIEQLLQERFPTARLLRADADTLQDPFQMRAMLNTMHNREADILLGTQSVVKGLDLPHVTLAAVLLADVGLSLPHFRAGERVFQLLTQLTGRSGRSRPGDVIIQTFRPDAPEVLAASTHETQAYLDSELKLRLHTGYPPASSMIRLIVKNASAMATAKSLASRAMAVAAKLGNDARITAAPAFFGGGKVWHVFLRGQDPRPVLTQLPLEEVTVDVDPMETV